MSSLAAFSILTAVLLVSVPSALVLIYRAWCAERAENETPAPGLWDYADGLAPAPAPDNVKGMNLADLDECELLWDMPACENAAAQLDQGLADLFKALGPPPEADDHTTNPTGDQP